MGKKRGEKTRATFNERGIHKEGIQQKKEKPCAKKCGHQGMKQETWNNSKQDVPAGTTSFVQFGLAHTNGIGSETTIRAIGHIAGGVLEKVAHRRRRGQVMRMSMMIGRVIGRMTLLWSILVGRVGIAHGI
jgi:hypothetical protein